MFLKICKSGIYDIHCIKCICHLVENVIPEELEHVPVAGLRPRLVQVQFSSIDLKNISIVVSLIG